MNPQSLVLDLRESVQSASIASCWQFVLLLLDDSPPCQQHFAPGLL